MATALINGITLQQGRYRIEQVLGEGGFGITYQATDMRLGRAVAIKELFILGCSRAGSVVHPPLTYTPQSWSKATQNFLLEARILAGLDHPGIVAVYDQFEENNTAYMVMKFIVGTTLSRLMAQRGGKLPEDEAEQYTVQVGQALEVVHAHNLLHRDIKPSNIMLQPNGQTVLIDFGAAREFALDRSVAVTAIASSGFSPPEQFYAKGRKGPYTDVFSLAATCYYLITGVAPTHELDEPPHTGLLPALNHALAFNPQERPQTVADFLAELSGQQPAPPLNAVSSVIQGGGGDALTDSYLQGAYTPLTPPSERTATNPRLLSTTIIPPQPPSAPTTTNVVPTELRMNVVPPQPVLPPAQVAERRRNPWPLIISGVAALALLTILAVLLLGHPEQQGSDKLIAAQATLTATANQAIIVASPTTAPNNSPTTATASNTPYPTNTPQLVANEVSPTAEIEMSAAAPPAISAPLLSPTSMPPSATPAPVAARAKPPTSTPFPPTHTPAPRPTNTPHPPTATPRPPTATPLPPPPNPTANPSTALGTGWSQLGPADFSVYYCARTQNGAVARLTRLPRNATALDWGCYTGDTQKVGGINMAEACRAKYGADVGSNFSDANDPNSWYCSRGGVKFASAPEQEYCAAQYLYGEAKLENRSDVQPAFRWACFAPTQLGPINADTACANQYGPGALGYWLTLDDPRWSCWRRQ